MYGRGNKGTLPVSRPPRRVVLLGRASAANSDLSAHVHIIIYRDYVRACVHMITIIKCVHEYFTENPRRRRVRSIIPHSVAKLLFFSTRTRRDFVNHCTRISRRHARILTYIHCTRMAPRDEPTKGYYFSSAFLFDRYLCAHIDCGDARTMYYISLLHARIRMRITVIILGAT